MDHDATETIHAGCVAIDGHGVLIAGASGSGKSDLALRLIDRGALLVSDDYTALSRLAGRLTARAPAAIAGKIEVRGIGIVECPFTPAAPVALAVELDDAPPRHPEPACRRLLDLDIPAIRIAALEASAPLKVELALKQVLAAR